jgi:hypothetical protein
MNKEYYRRFTEVYIPGHQDIKNNEAFSKIINDQIEQFVKNEKVTSYRIVNCETQALPASATLKSDNYNGYVMLIVHVAYLL